MYFSATWTGAKLTAFIASRLEVYEFKLLKNTRIRFLSSKKYKHLIKVNGILIKGNNVL